MSTSSVKDDELKDIELCYNALGLDMGDPPGKVEFAFKRLSETYRANMASPDPKAREEARESLRLVEEMYDKITKSVTYLTTLKDQEKRGKIQEGGERTKPADYGTEVTRSSLMNCPMCDTLIEKGSKVCPRCKGRIFTATEQLMTKLFSPTIIILLCSLIVIGVFAFLFLMYSDQIKDLIGSFRQESG